MIPHSLLVGAYPANVEDSETFDLLTSILKEGVSTFICLQVRFLSYIQFIKAKNVIIDFIHIYMFLLLSGGVPR